MTVQISVSNKNDDRVTSFSKYQFTHVGCGHMTHKPVMPHNEHVLKCDCGLEIHFPEHGSAELAITQVVIDEQPKMLDSESFHSNRTDSVQITSTGAA